jgi:hypothetical protein
MKKTTLILVPVIIAYAKFSDRVRKPRENEK